MVHNPTFDRTALGAVAPYSVQSRALDDKYNFISHSKTVIYPPFTNVRYLLSTRSLRPMRNDVLGVVSLEEHTTSVGIEPGTGARQPLSVKGDLS